MPLSYAKWDNLECDDDDEPQRGPPHTYSHCPSWQEPFPMQSLGQAAGSAASIEPRKAATIAPMRRRARSCAAMTASLAQPRKKGCLALPFLSTALYYFRRDGA